uniref:Epidermal retinol dehydrogenase 2 n=1 Tax=Plectus sambesii TaxID=2011161 RepID=A0A914VE52_9BILA
MAETDRNPFVAFGEEVLKALYGTILILGMALVASVKALLPCGVLPRKSVTGEVVLITGAGSGLGRLMALQFAKLGARLVLWDVNQAGNEQTAKMVKGVGGEVHSYTVDCSKRADIQSVAKQVKKEVGDVDILINNAGIVTGKKFLECPDELIERTMDVNVNAHFWTTKAFIGPMLERNHGHIVSIASMAGIVGIGTLTDYCASKFGAVGFSDSLTAELYMTGKTGVHVTTVCPTYIDTGMFNGAKTDSPNLLPLLKPEYVVDRIMEAILTNAPMLMLPRFAYFVAFFKGLLPVNAVMLLGDYFGCTKSMEHFTGRR